MVANNIEKAARDPGGPDHDYEICDPLNACRACLAASGLAIELTSDQIDALFKLVDIRRLAKGGIPVSESEYDDHLYAIARGEFEVSRREGADWVCSDARLRR